MNLNPGNNEDLPLVVERIDRSFDWKYFIFIFFAFIVYKHWPEMKSDIPGVVDLDKQKEREIIQREQKRQQALVAREMAEKKEVSIKRLRELSVSGITVEEMVENESSITINGYTQNNQKIALYMRLILSEIKEPQLNWIKSDERNGMKVSSFSLIISK